MIHIDCGDILRQFLDLDWTGAAWEKSITAGGREIGYRQAGIHVQYNPH